MSCTHLNGTMGRGTKLPLGKNDELVLRNEPYSVKTLYTARKLLYLCVRFKNQTRASAALGIASKKLDSPLACTSLALSKRGAETAASKVKICYD